MFTKYICGHATVINNHYVVPYNVYLLFHCNVHVDELGAVFCTKECCQLTANGSPIRCTNIGTT